MRTRRSVGQAQARHPRTPAKGAAVSATGTRVDGDAWCNRLIHADALDTLRELARDPQVAGRVVLAYLDPPFATEQDFRAGTRRTSTISSPRSDLIAYSDRLSGEGYLAFIGALLTGVRELLSRTGSIYVHIGLSMSHRVRVLLDEVFGAENFVNEIARVKCNPKNFQRRAFGNIRDTVLFYSKSEERLWNEVPCSFSEADLARLFPRIDAQGRRYTTTPLHAPGETRNGATGGEWRGLRPPPGRHWRSSPEELTRLEQAGLIEWSASGNPRRILFADELARTGKKRQDVWIFKDPQNPVYPTEKNLQLLETIILASSNPGDLVLDCVAGSGTTLVAAQKHGRRWIGIDRSPIAVERARRRLDAICPPGSYVVQCGAAQPPAECPK